MTPQQFLSMHAQAAAEFEGRPSPVVSKAAAPVGRPPKAVRQGEPPAVKRSRNARYRQRLRKGIKPMPKPWDYLCSLELKDIAWQAYRVASWWQRQDMASGELTHQELRESFATSLAEMFAAAISAHAVKEGGCWPADADTPLYADHVKVWENLSRDVPRSWRPEYPVFSDQLQIVDPATVAAGPGSLTKVDEGNSDAHDSKS